MDPSAKGNQEYRTREKKQVRNETRKNHDGCMFFFFFSLMIFSVEQVMHSHASVTSRLRSGDPRLGQIRRLVP